MEIKPENIFAAAAAVAVSALTFVEVKENYEPIKKKASEISMKILNFCLEGEEAND